MSDAPILKAVLPKEEIPRTYRSVAPYYDLWAALTESKARRRCLELADVQDGQSVLEVAVGTGLLFAEILERNPSGLNVGVDLTDAMLRRARHRIRASAAKNVFLQTGDAYQLGNPDESFDVLVNNYMFDLLPEEDFEIVLREFRRVLKPGGRLVIANMTRAEKWYQRLWEYLYRLNPRLMGGCRGVLLLPHLRRAGFADCRRETISQMGFPSEILGAIRSAT